MFLEYALVRDPAVADGAGAVIGGVTEDGGADFLSVEYRRPKNALDVVYTVEFSATLDSWAAVAGAVESVTDQGDGTEIVRVRAALPVGFDEESFVRLRVSSL